MIVRARRCGCLLIRDGFVVECAAHMRPVTGIAQGSASPLAHGRVVSHVERDRDVDFVYIRFLPPRQISEHGFEAARGSCVAAIERRS